MRIVFLATFLFFSNLYAQSVTVAVAANVSYAIESLQKAFNSRYPDIKVQTILGSSGKLSALISNGAPYDIFLSANMDYPNKLYKNALALEKPRVYAHGELILLSKKDINSTKDLLNSNIKKIAIANPKSAPYGKAALEVLEKSGLFTKIKDKLIYGQSVSQAFEYTLRVADAGFVAKSLLFSKQMQNLKAKFFKVEIDKTLYSPIEQGAVILQHAKNSNAALKFYNFLFSKEAKEILQQFGYIVP